MGAPQLLGAGKAEVLDPQSTTDDGRRTTDF
jgi:hypothetical protein